MTNKAPIASPIGLFMAGFSGVGGDYIPLKAIYRDAYQHLPNGIIFGLQINAGPTAPTKDSMIIDISFTGPDGSMALIHDPHIIEQVTDYPVDQATRGIAWFGAAKPPGYTPFSAYGIQTVQIKVAPRVAPTGTDPLPPRDFSPEAGGRIAEFVFEIKKGPIPAPVFNDD